MELCAAIRVTEENLVSKFVILGTMSNGCPINTGAFHKNLPDNSKMYLKLYPWHNTLASVYEVLLYRAKIGDRLNYFKNTQVICILLPLSSFVALSFDFPLSNLLTLSMLPSSGLLRSVSCLSTDVSKQPIGPNFKGQVSKKKILNLEDGTDRLPETSVLNQPTLHNNPENGIM